MASKKKSAKKAAKKSKTVIGQVIAFNKKNTEALADLIFTDKGGVVSMMKLCEGNLSNGKDGGRTLHCAVGEAYFQFVSKDYKDMRKILNVKGEKDQWGGRNDYESKYLSSTNDGPTGAAIDALVDVAHLKNPTEANKRKLAEALDDAMNENDDVCGVSIGEYAERSKQVATVLRKKVAPLLK